MRNIVIDGHGAINRNDEPFDFINSGNLACHLFCGVHEDINMAANLSNTLIRDIAHGNTDNIGKYFKKTTSNPLGVPFYEHRLYPIDKIEVTEDDGITPVLDELNRPVLEPSWDVDGHFLPSGNNVNRFRIDDMPVITITRGNSIYIRINYYKKPNDNFSRSLKLSSIISSFKTQYPNEELNFYWMACRGYIKPSH